MLFLSFWLRARTCDELIKGKLRHVAEVQHTTRVASHPLADVVVHATGDVRRETKEKERVKRQKGKKGV